MATSSASACPSNQLWKASAPSSRASRIASAYRCWWLEARIATARLPAYPSATMLGAPYYKSPNRSLGAESRT